MRLLQIEYKKLKGNKSFWIFSLLFLVFLPFIVILLPSLIGSDFVSLPQTAETSWYYISWVSSFFSMFILSFILIYHISNEYAYRTARQNVIDGLTRAEFVRGKIYLLLFLSLAATLYVFIIGSLGGLYFQSLPPSTNTLTSQMMQFMNKDVTEVKFGNIFNGVENVFSFFIQITAYFSLAMLLGFLIKKGALAILIYFASFIVELIVGVQLSVNGFESVYKYFPLNSFSRLLPNPGIKSILNGLTAPSSLNWLNVLVVLVYIAIFLFLARFLFLKRDIN